MSFFKLDIKSHHDSNYNLAYHTCYFELITFAVFFLLLTPLSFFMHQEFLGPILLNVILAFIVSKFLTLSAAVEKALGKGILPWLIYMFSILLLLGDFSVEPEFIVSSFIKFYISLFFIRLFLGYKIEKKRKSNTVENADLLA